MRNLKKVLSLALALVMLLGMMVIGASAADFKDADSIKNTEAVDVVSGIEVLKGDEKGNFNPEGTLTRAEAAVVIAKLDLGEAFGNLATTNASTFTDVPANHWAKAYIDYCTARGLIVGSAGKFMPNDKVSGVQFGLMVARVLGYEDGNEDLGGAAWEVKAAALARKAGLTKDVTIGSAAMTRDEMAQMAFNALKADMVEYKNSAITIGNVTIPAGKASAVEANPRDSDYGTGDKVLQLCEQKFPKLSKDSGVDPFGRDTVVWKVGKNQVAEVESGNATVTYTAETGSTKIDKDLKNCDWTKLKKVNVLTNGVAEDSETDTTVKSDAITGAASLATKTGNGKLVEVYVNSDNEVTKVVIVTYDVSSLISVTEKNDKTTYKFEGKSAKTNDEDNTNVILKGAVEVDDVVTIATVDNKYYVYPTTSFTGSQTSNNTNKKTIVVGGQTYTVATAVTGVAMDDFKNSSDEATFYLDQFDLVVRSTVAEAAPEYIWVKEVAADNKVTLDNGGVTVQVRGVLADGTVGTFTLKTSVAKTGDKLSTGGDKTDGSLYCGDIALASNSEFGNTVTSATTTQKVGNALDGDSDNTFAGKKVFSYTGEPDAVTLKEITALASDTAAEKTVRATINNYAGTTSADNNGGTGSILMNSDTTFVLYDTTTKTARVVVGRENTGLTNAGSSPISGVAVLTTTKTGVGPAKLVFANDANMVVDNGDYAYVDGKYSTDLVDGKDVKVYNGILPDGSSITLYGGSADVDKAGVYCYNTENSKITRALISGTTMKDTVTATDHTMFGKLDATSKLVKIKGGASYYTITNDTAINYIKSGVDTLDGNTGYVILDSKNDKVETIFVTGDKDAVVTAAPVESGDASSNVNQKFANGATKATVSGDATIGTAVTVPKGGTLTLSTTGSITAVVTAKEGANVIVNGTGTTSGSGAIKLEEGSTMTVKGDATKLPKIAAGSKGSIVVGREIPAEGDTSDGTSLTNLTTTLSVTPSTGVKGSTTSVKRNVEVSGDKIVGWSSVYKMDDWAEKMGGSNTVSFHTLEMTPGEAGKVVGEYSTDGGKTWTKVYDGFGSQEGGRDVTAQKYEVVVPVGDKVTHLRYTNTPADTSKAAEVFTFSFGA